MPQSERSDPGVPSEKHSQTPPQSLPPRSKSGPKLSPAAKALVIERIIAGDDNDQINIRLRAEGHLAACGTLSARSLYEYRNQPDAKRCMEELTITARQMGHAEYSAGLIATVEIAQAARGKLIEYDPKSGNPIFASGLNNQQLASLINIHFKAQEVIQRVFQPAAPAPDSGPSAPVRTGEDALADLITYLVEKAKEEAAQEQDATDVGQE